MQKNWDDYQQGPTSGGLSNQSGPDGGASAYRQRPQPVELTPEERNIFKECNSEAYFKRSIPAAAFLGGLTLLGVRNGFLQSHPRFGVGPKVAAALLIGYFGGKISYAEACREKFLTKLPNSNISIAIRKARGEQVYFEEQPQIQEPNVFNEEAAESTSDTKKKFSYDDLREQHRRKMYSPQVPQTQPSYHPPAPSLMSPSRDPPPSLLPQDEPWVRSTPTQTRGTNKYGDEGFE